MGWVDPGNVHGSPAAPKWQVGKSQGSCQLLTKSGRLGLTAADCGLASRLATVAGGPELSVYICPGHSCLHIHLPPGFPGSPVIILGAPMVC